MPRRSPEELVRANRESLAQSELRLAKSMNPDLGKLIGAHKALVELGFTEIAGNIQPEITRMVRETLKGTDAAPADEPGLPFPDGDANAYPR